MKETYCRAWIRHLETYLPISPICCLVTCQVIKHLCLNTTLPVRGDIQDLFYVNMYVCIYVCVWCMCTCVYLCMCICIYGCVNMCMYMYVHVYICLCIYIYIYIGICIWFSEISFFKKT